MSDHARKSALELIGANVARFGYHVYVVKGGACPRFAYTIGASSRLGSELVLAGASYYAADEVTRIINEAVAMTAAKRTVDRQSVHINSLGEFVLRKVDESWTRELMLGALDYFGVSTLPAFQITPSRTTWTIDVPDLSRPWDPRVEPVWRWLRDLGRTRYRRARWPPRTSVRCVASASPKLRGGRRISGSCSPGQGPKFPEPTFAWFRSRPWSDLIHRFLLPSIWQWVRRFGAIQRSSPGTCGTKQSNEHERSVSRD